MSQIKFIHAADMYFCGRKCAPGKILWSVKVRNDQNEVLKMVVKFIHSLVVEHGFLTKHKEKRVCWFSFHFDAIPFLWLLPWITPERVSTTALSASFQRLLLLLTAGHFYQIQGGIKKMDGGENKHRLLAENTNYICKLNQYS